VGAAFSRDHFNSRLKAAPTHNIQYRPSLFRTFFKRYKTKKNRERNAISTAPGFFDGTFYYRILFN